MFGMIAVPAGITLRHSPRLRAESTPYGYTVRFTPLHHSIVVIGLWFIPGGIQVSKKAFWWTIGLLFPLSASLDFLRSILFYFPNVQATLGIKAPALGGGCR